MRLPFCCGPLPSRRYFIFPAKSTQGENILRDDHSVLQILFIQPLKAAEFIPQHGAAFHLKIPAGQIQAHENSRHIPAPEFCAVPIFGKIEDCASPLVLQIKRPRNRHSAAGEFFRKVLAKATLGPKILIRSTRLPKSTKGEEIKKEKVTPKGSPALVNPINSGIDEQEQNGVTVPSKAAAMFAHTP